MNIKSLLIGSAAALVAVSGARAADAVVVAEPEPVEYVRVCDVYGTGFFYIPGTETCLKIDGYLRYDIRAGEDFIGGYGGMNDVLDKEDFANGIIELNDTYYKRARAALRIDARSETELGTLRAFFHINFNYDTSRSINIDSDGDGIADTGGFTDAGDSTGINHAYIELGGFRIGKTDSLFSTFTDYSGTIIADDVIPYGPFGTHQIAYTFNAGNGFTAAIAVEEGDGGAGLFDTDGDGVGDTLIGNLYTIDSYVPHVVGGVGYTAGWGSIKVVAGYDSVWEEWAAKARLDVNATEALSLFVMAGFKDDDGGEPNYYGAWNGDWAIWGGGQYVVSPKAKINVMLAYDDAEDFQAVANVNYELVPGLVITPEIQYTENFDVDDTDGFAGWLRFQRNF